MGNPLCHFELAVSDVEKSQRFYKTLLGWEFAGSAMPDYTMIDTGSEPGGGMMEVQPEMPGPCMTVYFLVDDIPAVLEKVEQAGGKVLVPQTPIPDVGAYAVIGDPDGLTFGIFKSQ